MLALTPAPLQTAGERAFFAELARWDTGGAVRSAVVASLPLADGPMQRRLSDAVLFVPEGLAVVRVVEVVRQRGVVTALPEGAWTIGPGDGPGEVLQLAGGGSTPLDGLMRSGMEVAVRLRRAGLEPGRIARLTVLVGELTGLVPADGDLGEGDQVALLEPRALLLGVSRAARYAGTGNPRLWTTADVRAGLEALGMQGRGPSVEELNGEGFPYSPYVLRKPELLAPAAMTAAATAPPPATPPPATPPAAPPATGGFVGPTPGGPRVDPAAAAAVAAAAIRADEAAAAHQALVAARQDAPRPDAPRPDAPRPDAVPARPAAAAVRQPVTVPPSAAPQSFAGGAALAPYPPPSRSAGPSGYAPPTAWHPQTPAETTMEETGGIGGLFGPAEPAHPTEPAGPAESAEPADPPRLPPTLQAPAVSALPARPAGVPLVGARIRPGRNRRIALLAGGAVLLAVLLVVALAIGLGGGDDADTAGDSAAATAAAPPASARVPAEDAPEPGSRTELDGTVFTLEEVVEDDTCTGHAYGTVADFFSDTDCAGLARALYSADVGGRAVVVSVAAVDMGDDAGARALRALADRDGSGNVSDLLREGVRYPGGPVELSGAEYASAVHGTVVTIVEAAWVDPAAGGSAADLDLVAGTGLALPMPDPTAG